MQYAGAVELQRRLAPHAHFAVRGTLPRALWRQVAAATYQQVWWPAFDQPTYPVNRPPTWDADRSAYTDPATGTPLPTWDHAMAALSADPDADPAHVVRLGRIDARGINDGHPDAERSIRYVTKYVTKDITETARITSDPQQAHRDRLHAELSTLPCAPTCANWLLYGVQPKNAKAGLVPGRCRGKVHQQTTLGFTGRRVLVSRNWSTKTLADLRADNAAWVRAVLAAHPDTDPDGAELASPAAEGRAGDDAHADEPADEPDRYVYALARPDDPDVLPYQHRILAAIAARDRWRAHLLAARQQAAELSATIWNVGVGHRGRVPLSGGRRCRRWCAFQIRVIGPRPEAETLMRHLAEQAMPLFGARVRCTCQVRAGRRAGQVHAYVTITHKEDTEWPT